MKCVYKFNVDCGRQGTLSSVFVADEKEVENIIGKTVYFGEVLGKHSEVIVDITEEDIVKITDDATIVEFVDKHFGSIGHNPFDYINEDEDEDE
jgi:hypothetical protein